YGPRCAFEMSRVAAGTVGVWQAIANLEDAVTTVGGADSASAAQVFGCADKFSHIATAGGASLEYLEGKELPGLKAIDNAEEEDRKSTRLNSSHVSISYAVFCLKKKSMLTEDKCGP